MKYLKLEKKPIDTKGLPKKEVAKGELEEHEHTDNNRIAKQISIDHVKEDPNYYTKLEHMKEAYVRGFFKAAKLNGYL
ncbi:hypothetical protein CCP3SC5AM1_1260007 [Gammaproteobacteria bacterium]